MASHWKHKAWLLGCMLLFSNLVAAVVHSNSPDLSFGTTGSMQVKDTLTITGQGTQTVNLLRVYVDITYPRVSDLTVTLLCNASDVNSGVILTNRPSCSSANIAAYFSNFTEAADTTCRSSGTAMTYVYYYIIVIY
jgi:hypothetical protein